MRLCPPYAMASVNFVIASDSEAIQFLRCRRLDCFGTVAPRNDGAATEIVTRSELLLEEQIRIGIVIEAVDLGPAGAAVELTGFGQRAVGVEAQDLDR
jgi:hypothetical protein